MFNNSKENFGLYEGNPLLRRQNTSKGFEKSFKSSPDRLKKRERKWKFLMFLSFLVDCGVSSFFLE